MEKSTENKQTKAIKRIVTLTSGGDAPGMNATLRAVVRTAIYHGMEVYGSEMGFHGLAHQQLSPLNARFVANCIQRGGTLLKTARFNDFHDKKIRDQTRAFLVSQDIDALVVLGGNGSFAGARILHQEGGPEVIGIPCTIDNDINGTEYCIGFDTACNTALDAIDKIRDTALSLERNFLIEVMGRASGFIAVNVGIAGGAEIILTPEFPMTIDQLAKRVGQQHRKKLASIIVSAEAGQPGHSVELAQHIKEKTGIDYKVCILGHTQRGGSPTYKDRIMGSLMGAKAIEILTKGITQKMIALKDGTITAVDFPDPNNSTRYFNDQALLRVNTVVCG